MTETPGKEIAKSILAGQLALKDPKATADSVLTAVFGAEMAELARSFALEAMPPKRIAVSPEQAIVLSEIQETIQAIQWPTETRELAPGEHANLLNVRGDLDTIAELIDATKESIREAAFNSFDRVAEREGRVDENTPKDDKGHYILPDKESGAVPGCEEKFTRETRRGAIVYGEKCFDGDLLLAAFEKGTIDRKTYLRWTRATRVVDKEAMFKDMKDPELLAVIRAIVNVDNPSASLNVRKNA